MNFVGAIFYQLFLRLYQAAAWAASPFNAKAKKWVDGRKNWVKELKAFTHTNTKPIIWMHCASLGEFEQGRPIAEGLLKKFPNYTLVVSFFSPSGYEVQKNYPLANYIFYLPMDGKVNASTFIKQLQPSIALFVKYEYWYYYLRELHNLQIPIFLIAGVFRKSQPFFKWYGGFYRKMLGFFTEIFVQTQSMGNLLNGIHVTNYEVSGDSRFDRVIEVAKANFINPNIETFSNGKLVLVAGSTWKSDIEALAEVATKYNQLSFIIAPHNIDVESLQATLQYFPNALLWSKYDGLPTDNRILIIDTIGMLSKLYAIGKICYVGGGFTKDGVHNVLEAAVYYKPVIIGSNYDKYFEAEELVNVGGAISITNGSELCKSVENLLHNENEYKKISELAGSYVNANKGATDRVLNYFQEKRLLTN